MIEYAFIPLIKQIPTAKDAAVRAAITSTQAQKMIKKQAAKISAKTSPVTAISFLPGDCLSSFVFTARYCSAMISGLPSFLTISSSE